MSISVVLALGSNLGDSAATLDAAVRSLSETAGVQVLAVAPYVETAPVGGPDQPRYLNAVVLASTTLTPLGLLALCHRIEAAHGRERTVRWGARTLDIDVISYGRPGEADEVVQGDPALTLPHPRAHERAFVLEPWAAVDPHAVLRMPDGTVADVRTLLRQLEGAAL